MAYITTLSDEQLADLSDVFLKIVEFNESEHPGEPITYGPHGQIKIRPSDRPRLSNEEISVLERMIQDHNQRRANLEPDSTTVSL